MLANAFVDSNVVLYALGPYSDKTPHAAALLANRPIISTQVLSEVSNVALRKFGLPPHRVQQLQQVLVQQCQVHLISPTTLSSALNLVQRYQYSWYDSLILATALDANCTVVYSEDMQHGQWIDEQLQIKNPFATL